MNIEVYFLSQFQNVTKGDWIKGEALTIQQHVKAGRGVIKICSDLRIWLEKSHVCACFETCTAFAGLKLLPHHGIVQFCSEWWCHPILFVIHFLFLNFDWVWCHYTSDTNNCIRTVFGACTLQKNVVPRQSDLELKLNNQVFLHRSIIIAFAFDIRK